jgi:hypothetical protein
MAHDRKTCKHIVIDIKGHLLEKEVTELHVPRDKTLVPEMAAHLATRMRFSDFHIEVADDAILSETGCSIFIGQSVVKDTVLIAIYTPRGLTPDLFFPMNEGASEILNNRTLKVYGGAIVARRAEKGVFSPLALEDFRREPAVRAGPFSVPEAGAIPAAYCGRANRRGVRAARPPKTRRSAPGAADSETWRAPPEAADATSRTTISTSCSDPDLTPTPKSEPEIEACAIAERAETLDAALEVGEANDGLKLLPRSGPWARYLIALWDFVAATDVEIDVRTSDLIEVLQRNVEDGEWSYGCVFRGPRHGSIGYFPDKVLTTYPTAVKALCARSYATEAAGCLAVTAGETVEVVYRDVGADVLFARRGSEEGWVPAYIFK